MFQIGLLLLTGPIRFVVESITQYLKCANKSVLERLYVKLEPDFSRPLAKFEAVNLSSFSSIVPLIYDRASALCSNLDVRIVLSNINKWKTEGNEWYKIDVVLTNSTEDDCNIVKYVDSLFKRNCQNVIKLDKIDILRDDLSNKSPLCVFNCYKTVCLGGTFDRLHNGHKVLLSEAVLRATEKLIVGVTGGPMIKKKVLWELIEPVEKRISDVKKFLIDVDPSLYYEVVSITDPYGPTITEPDINCIVVSAETKTGGEKVNIERKSRGMSELSMYIVNLVENVYKNPEEDEKLSSSTTRMKLLGHPLHKSKITPELENSYCVLLKGYPLSGKSCIINYFQALGVQVLCCNEMLNSIICEDSDLKGSIIEMFSDEVISPKGSLDYKTLMVECLKNKEKQKWICMLVSDRINLMIQQKLLQLQQQGTELILIEDSMLLDIGMSCGINEIWAAVLPISEISRRLQQYYGLTEKEAMNAATSMCSNGNIFVKANIVFCDQWSSHHLKKQMENAWSYLQHILKCNKSSKI